jgi:hypothetical protein
VRHLDESACAGEGFPLGKCRTVPPAGKSGMEVKQREQELREGRVTARFHAGQGSGRGPAVGRLWLQLFRGTAAEAELEVSSEVDPGHTSSCALGLMFAALAGCEQQTSAARNCLSGRLAAFPYHDGKFRRGACEDIRQPRHPRSRRRSANLPIPTRKQSRPPQRTEWTATRYRTSEIWQTSDLRSH